MTLAPWILNLLSMYIRLIINCFINASSQVHTYKLSNQCKSHTACIYIVMMILVLLFFVIKNYLLKERESMTGIYAKMEASDVYSTSGSQIHSDYTIGTAKTESDNSTQSFQIRESNDIENGYNPTRPKWPSLHLLSSEFSFSTLSYLQAYMPTWIFPFIFCKLRIIVDYDFHFFLISLAKRGLLTPKKNRHVQNRACPSRNFNAITSLCNYKRDQPSAELGFWLNRSYNN